MGRGEKRRMDLRRLRLVHGIEMLVDGVLEYASLDWGRVKCRVHVNLGHGWERGR